MRSVLAQSALTKFGPSAAEIASALVAPGKTRENGASKVEGTTDNAPKVARATPRAVTDVKHISRLWGMRLKHVDRQF